MNRLAAIAFSALSAASIATCTAAPPAVRMPTSQPTNWPTPLVMTYGDDKDVPLPFLVGGSDLAIYDWDGDGRNDLLTCGNGGGLILRRNVGTPTEPRFANVYKEETSVLTDDRVGRFFAVMRRSGVNGTGGRRMPIIAFEKHKSIGDIGKVQLKLHLFVPPEDDAGAAGKWSVIQARSAGNDKPLEAFSDVWMSPAVECVDWNGDGRDDVLVGAYHPSIAQPDGRYTAGFNHPDSSWVGEAGRLYIMLNESSGDRFAFGAPQLVTAGDTPIKGYGSIFPRAMDLDHDGLFDLVIGSHRPGIAWYRNTGDATRPRFVRGGELADTAGPIRSALTLRVYFGDLTGDGQPEMLGASYFAFSMGLLRYDHTTDRSSLATGWMPRGYLPMASNAGTPLTGQGICSPDVIDWNGDGLRDLMIGAEPCAPMITLNTGTRDHPIWSVPERLKYADGRPLEYYAVEVGRGSVWGPIEHYLETVQPRLADWDGDGVLDMLTGSMGARTLFLRGRVVSGELRFDRPIAFTQHDGSPRDVAHRIQPFAIDFDRDGKLDLIDCDTDNVVTLWRGDGSTKLAAPEPFRGPDAKPLQLNPSKMNATSGRRCLAMVDWNLDGERDLITYNAFGPTVWGGFVRLHLGERGKPMQFAAPIDLFPIISHHQGGIALTDWDEDGYLDIVCGGDHSHLPVGSEPRGQLFVYSGKDLPVPPAKRSATDMPVPRAVPMSTSSTR